ncbi:MAG: long-chain-fatty-acid--CoA ligase [Chloroflexi bacterium]|nr:long-chain-fatty-acid--CoA ligase [Chloroflexota bacterium]
MEVPLLVNDFLRRSAKLYGPSEAVIDGDKRFTWSEFNARVNQQAHALLDAGVGKGDRVGIIAPNSHQFLETFYATAAIGAIIVPMNYRLIPADFEYMLEHSGSKVVLVDAEFAHMVDEVRNNLNSVEHFIAIPFEDIPITQGWTNYEDWIASQPTVQPPDPGLEETDLLSINYTSGTTARPKGVMITHRNAYINAYNFIAHLRISQDDAEMWTLPMFHANGWGGPYAITAMGGKHVVLRAPDAADMYQVIQDENCTFACMAPAVLARILEFEHKDNYNITVRPRFTVAGAPPPQAFIERLEKELGWEFIQIYGLTETSPILTVSEVKPYLGVDEDGYFGTKVRAGHDVIGVEVKVVRDSGREVAWDDEEVGEVVARSNVVLRGYWQQQEETDKVIVDGWFHTGDMATVNQDGYINIVDRAKDVIISGGENISSIEVEDVLYDHPAVLEAAVIGVPSEQWGETPLALIVPREGHDVTRDDIVAHCRATMAGFKIPRRVEFVETLPRTATGKLKKFELREAYWEGVEKRVN